MLIYADVRVDQELGDRATQLRGEIFHDRLVVERGLVREIQLEVPADAPPQGPRKLLVVAVPMLKIKNPVAVEV